MPLHAIEIEGQVTSTIKRVGPNILFKVMNIEVVVDPAVLNPGGMGKGVVHTPTVDLTEAQLTNPTAIPGRTGLSGFEGGTAIVIGNYDPSDGKIYVNNNPPPPNQGAVPFEANPHIEIEPAETVLVGPVTQNAGGVFKVMGRNIIMLTDDRLMHEPPRNELGFVIELDTTPPLTLASVEGYYGDDDNFYAFIIETDGELTTHDPQISITRAEGRTRNTSYELKLRGGLAVENVSPSMTQANIDLYRINAGVEQRIGSYSQPLTPGVFLVRYDISDSFVKNAVNGNACPEQIRVKFANEAGVTPADFEVEVRTD